MDLRHVLILLLSSRPAAGAFRVNFDYGSIDREPAMPLNTEALGRIASIGVDPRPDDDPRTRRAAGPLGCEPGPRSDGVEARAGKFVVERRARRG
jgi:hypothetical protein